MPIIRRKRDTQIVWRAFATALSLVVALFVPASMSEFTASAAVSNKCDGTAANDQNQLRVAPSHGKVFYIDSSASQFIDSSYASYIVSNLSAAERDSLWVHVDTFTGGAVGLANPADATQSLEKLSATGGANATTTAFVLLKANSATNSAQSHVVRIFDGKPGSVGALELYSCTYSFVKVAETIRASSNKITAGPTATSVSQIGSTMTITVEGATGTVGAGSAVDGSMMWITPAARSSWPTNALRLESTSVSVFSNNGRTTQIAGSPFTDQLRIPLTAGGKYYYTNVFRFRIVGKSSTPSTQIVPMAQISSGTQIKHTTIPNVITTLDASQPVLAMSVTKSASTVARIVNDQTELDYSIALTNRGGAAVTDQIADYADSNLEFVPGSAAYNGTPIADPVLDTSAGRRYIFTGPFDIPVGTTLAPTTRFLTYSMRTVTCATTLSVSNSATASLGQTVIGSSANSFSATTVSGTCGNTTVDVVVDEEALAPVARTAGASGVTTAVATLNGLVDPNGVAGEAITFTWGTDKALVGATTVAAGTTTSSTSEYAVNSNISGLQQGVTYYFRISVGSSIGDIFSFTTLTSAGTPTALTTAATNITFNSTTASATLNGQIDPNLINQWGVKAKFQYAREVSPSTGGACSAVGTLTTTAFVQSQETETAWADLVLQGAFPTDVSWMNSSGGTQITGLTQNVVYCYRIIAYYDGTDPSLASKVDHLRNSVTAPNWEAFLATVKADQVITFEPPPDTVVGAVEAADATASSSLDVTYTSDTPEVCASATDGTITAVEAGVCSVTASQPGNDDWNVAEPVTVLFLVATRPQTITFAPLTALAVGGTLATDATASSNLTVTLSSNTPSVCSVGADGTITALALGECSITATQAGDATWSAAAPVTRTLRVKSAQAITFGSATNIATGSTQTLLATSDANLPVTYSTLTPENCAVAADGTVTGLNIGSCTIAANQSGDLDYFAAPEASISFTVLSGPPVVATDTLADGLVLTPYSVTLVAGGGNGVYSNWTLVSGTLPTGMTIGSDGILQGTPSETGTFHFTVTVTSDSLLSPERSLSLTVNRKPNVIGTTDVVATYGDAPGTASVSVTSNLAVSLLSSDDSVVVVNGTELTFTGAGQTTINVTSLGDDTYVDAAPSSFTVTVNKALLTVNAPAGTAAYGDAEPVLGEPEILGFAFSEGVGVLDTAPNCVSDYTPTSRPDSSPAVTCSGGNDNNYRFEYFPNVVDVNKLSQTVEFPALDTVDVESLQSASAEASSGLDIVYESLTPEVCTVDSSGSITPLIPGTCTIRASQPGSEIYEPAVDEPERSFTVTPLRPVIDDTPVSDGTIDAVYSDSLLATLGYDGEYSNWRVVAGTLPAGLTLDPATGSITGTPSEAGEFTIDIRVDSRDLVSLVQTFTFTIDKLTQSISAPDIELDYGDPQFATSISSDADMGVDLSPDRTNSIQLSGAGEITVLAVGVTTVTVTAASSGRYAEATTTFTVTVSPATLAVIGRDYQLTFGDNIPTDVGVPSLSGFEYQDEPADLTLTPLCTTGYHASATAKADYAVTCSGGSAPNYVFDYIPGLIEVEKAHPVLTFSTSEPTDLRPGGSQHVEVVTTAPVNMQPTAVGECHWEGWILVAADSEGDCDLTFTSPATDDFFEGQLVRSIVITGSAKLHRTLTLNTSNGLTTMPANVSPEVLTAIVPNVGLPTIESTTPEVCQLNPDNTIRWISLGDCILEGTLEPTSEYYAERETLVVTGTEISRTLTLVAMPSRVTLGEVATTVITDSANIGNAMVETLTPDRCTIDGSRVTPASVGSCMVRAVAVASGLFASAQSSSVEIIADAPDTTDDGGGGGGGGGGDGDGGGGGGGDRGDGGGAGDGGDGGGDGGGSENPLTPDSGAETVRLDDISGVIGGFAPNSVVTIQGTGAKTVGMLPVTGIPALDNLLAPLLLTESGQRMATALASAGSVAAGNGGIPPIASGNLSRPEKFLTIDTGFEDTRRFLMSEISTSETIQFTLASSVLTPGTPFSALVTSDPRVVLSGTVSPAGELASEIAIPIDLLEPGIHNVRLLGKRNVGTVSADASGQLTLNDETMALLAEFDPGTETTVRLTGTRLDGGTRVVVIFVPLPSAFPWWLIIAMTFALALCLVGAVWRRRIHNDGTLPLLGATLGTGLLTSVGAWLLASSAAAEIALSATGITAILIIAMRFLPPQTLPAHNAALDIGGDSNDLRRSLVSLVRSA